MNRIKVAENITKCLGIYVGHNKEECYDKSWMKIYEDMQNILIMETQNINMIGKILHN